MSFCMPGTEGTWSRQWRTHSSVYTLGGYSDSTRLFICFSNNTIDTLWLITIPATNEAFRTDRYSAIQRMRILRLELCHTNQSPMWGLVHLNLGLFLNSPRSWVLSPFYKHIPFHTIFGGMKRFSGELYPKQNIKSWKGHNNTKPRLGEGCLIMSIWHTHEITKIINLKSWLRYNHTF